MATQEKSAAETQAFAALMARVRAGDDQAAVELVRCYEPTIRMAIRVRMNHSGLRRLLDSMDVCQSVLANFFVRAASGQFELNTPAQLVKLLVTMARNKLINHTQSQRAARRDHRRRSDVAAEEIAGSGPSPSRVATIRELLEKVRNHLTPEERRLADLRAAGGTWAEIAAEVGGNPDAVRFRLTRALDRVARELKLDS